MSALLSVLDFELHVPCLFVSMEFGFELEAIKAAYNSCLECEDGEKCGGEH